MKRTTSLILCLVLSISLFAQSRGMTFLVHNETLTSVLKKQGRRIKLRCPPKVLTGTLHPSLPSIFSG